MTAPVKPTDALCERVNLLYMMIGSDKIYSDKDFPIKNVNPSLIDKVFEDSTSKFLGKSSARFVVTQCVPIPKAELRKKFGNKYCQFRTINKSKNMLNLKRKRENKVRIRNWFGMRTS
ncbi:hypothetical protein Hanom_Chr05g00453411 [Helianthus anomalus]